MDVFLLVVVIGALVWLSNVGGKAQKLERKHDAEREALADLRREVSALRIKLDKWSTWGNQFHEGARSLGDQLEGALRRIEALERGRPMDTAQAAARSVARAAVAQRIATEAEAVREPEAGEAAVSMFSANVGEEGPEPTVATVGIEESPDTMSNVSEPAMDTPATEPATTAPATKASERATDTPATKTSEPTKDAVASAKSEGTQQATASAHGTTTRAHVTGTSDFRMPEGFNKPPSSLLPKLDWESLIGVRLFSWVAGLSLLCGAIFFLRYSVENGWLSPPVRMTLGFVTGIALLAVCEWKGQRYRITANAMDAAGIGTLFATSFAANVLWHLVPSAVAFVLLALVTAVAVLLAMRRKSQFIALLGLVGGFATPILLSSGENRPVSLFGYLLLLNVGLAIVSHRKGWPTLSAISIGLTILYQWGWFARFVSSDAGQLPIAMAIFVVFPLAWLGLARLGRSASTQGQVSWLATLLSASSALPLLLAVVAAWIPAFGQQYLLLFAYLFVLDVGLLILDFRRPEQHLGSIASAVTLLVWYSWPFTNYSSAAWPVVTALASGFVLLFLSRHLLRERAELPRTLDRLTAAGLLGVFPLFALVERSTATPFLLFGVLLALLLAVAAAAVRSQDGLLYYAAVPFVIIAEACWSAKYLSEPHLLAGFIVYLSCALTFVAVPLLARKLARPLDPSGWSTVIPVLNLALLLFLSMGKVAAHSLWMIGVMAVVLNVSAFIEAQACRRSLAAFIGICFSWIVLGIWWGTSLNAEQVVAGSVVVLVMTLLSVGGALWLRTANASTGDEPWSEQGPLLGIIGHLFLLFAAAHPSLNRQPAALLAVALVLDLALLVASIYLARALFVGLALGLTVLILGVWATAAKESYLGANACEVTLLAVTTVVGLGLLLPPLARRRGIKDLPFVRARDATLLSAQALLVMLAAESYPPSWQALTLAQAVVLGLLLVFARAGNTHWLALAGWGGATLCELVWSAIHFDQKHWWQLLFIALPPYILLTAYPIFCQFRARVLRWPFVVAICASGSFFFAGYHSLTYGPLASYMGALPLVEALALSGLLLYLLRVVEPASPRDIGRLALVAAVALGFATTAIPLQIENEWLTIAWSLEAAVLGWLYARLRHTGLIAGSLALATAVTVRLIANREVFLYHERSATPILNHYLYAYLVSAAALYLASWFLRDAIETRFAWLSRTAWFERVMGTLLLFALLNIEIADFYSVGPSITFRFSATLAQDLTYTIGWALFAISMLTVGIVLRGRTTRIAALLLLTITIAKCFLHDLWRLGGLYRVGSFVGLALCLALVAIMLQRFVLKPVASEDKS